MEESDDLRSPFQPRSTVLSCWLLNWLSQCPPQNHSPMMWSSIRWSDPHSVEVTRGATSRRIRIFISQILSSSSYSKNAVLSSVLTPHSVAQLCLTLHDPEPTLTEPTKVLCPWDFQARVLEWAAIPFSRGPSQPRDQTCISYISYISRRVLYCWETRKAPWFPTFPFKSNREFTAPFLFVW